MKLTSAIQEALLALLCYDEKDGSVAASLVEARYFDAVYRDIAEQAILYRERFQQPPGEHTVDLFDAAAEKQEDRADLFERLYESVRDTATSINGRYVLDRARSFMRYQTIKRSLSSAIRHLDSGTEEGLEQAEAALSAALETTADVFDPGTKFIHDIEGSLAFYDRWEDALPTGVPALDARGLGPARGRLHFYVGSTGSGKSWWLVNLATRAHQHAKKVMYITLELGEEEVCQRLVQSFFSMSKGDARRLSYRKFQRTEKLADGGLEFSRQHLRNIASLTAKKAPKNLRRKMLDLQGDELLVVKGFPPGMMTAKQLDAYLNLMEQHESFVPDLLLIDYAAEMALPRSMERWEALNENMQHLKRVAVERDVAVATVGQVKVSGATAMRVDKHHTGGAWDQSAKVDVQLTYTQTDEEKSDGIARLFVAKARTDEDRFEILISQKYEIGQYVLSSIRLGKNYYKQED